MMAIMFISFLGLMFIGLPVFYSLGLSSIIYIYLLDPSFMAIVPQRVWAGTDIYTMIALPLFILAGELMNRGGITRRIIDFSLLTLRPLNGGLGEVNVFSSMIFGGISGSSVADTSAIGSVMIPEMTRKGYSKRFTTGVTVASSTMGMIIPPSVPMLTYSMISGASIGNLFLAGVIPGLLIGVSQFFISNRISKKHGYLRHNEAQILEPKKIIRDGIIALIMPLLIVISISFGIATATESAGIAVLYSFVVGYFYYRELQLKDLPDILKRTGLAAASVMIIIGFSMIFSWILAMDDFPVKVYDFFVGSGFGKIQILLLLIALILFIGMFIDVTPALLLLTPIMLPVMQSIGVNELQFGAIMIVGLAIGLVTPPLGMCLNACAKIPGVDANIMEIFKGAVPFLVCNIIVLVLVIFIPEISNWLPSIIGR